MENFCQRHVFRKDRKSYSAYLVLTDDGQKSSYALEFDREKTGA